MNVQEQIQFARFFVIEAAAEIGADVLAYLNRDETKDLKRWLMDRTPPYPEFREGLLIWWNKVALEESNAIDLTAALDPELRRRLFPDTKPALRERRDDGLAELGPLIQQRNAHHPGEPIEELSVDERARREMFENFLAAFVEQSGAALERLDRAAAAMSAEYLERQERRLPAQDLRLEFLRGVAARLGVEQTEQQRSFVRGLHDREVRLVFAYLNHCDIRPASRGLLRSGERSKDAVQRLRRVYRRLFAGRRACRPVREWEIGSEDEYRPLAFGTGKDGALYTLEILHDDRAAVKGMIERLSPDGERVRVVHIAGTAERYAQDLRVTEDALHILFGPRGYLDHGDDDAEPVYSIARLSHDGSFLDEKILSEDENIHSGMDRLVPDELQFYRSFTPMPEHLHRLMFRDTDGRRFSFERFVVRGDFLAARIGGRILIYALK